MSDATDWPKELDLRRRQLRMSKTALAKRAGVPPATVHRILSGKEKNAGIGNVAAIAAALGMPLFENPESASDFLHKQAAAKARRLIRMLQGTMALEAQAVDQGALNEMVEQTTRELLVGPGRRLWDE
jgi:transcriptional regulator with XRE-family HTH domain